MPPDYCSECGALITEEALRLNGSGLFCVRCEGERRERIDRGLDEIDRNFKRMRREAQGDE